MSGESINWGPLTRSTESNSRRERREHMRRQQAARRGLASAVTVLLASALAFGGANAGYAEDAPADPAPVTQGDPAPLVETSPAVEADESTGDGAEQTSPPPAEAAPDVSDPEPAPVPEPEPVPAPEPEPLPAPEPAPAPETDAVVPDTQQSDDAVVAQKQTDAILAPSAIALAAPAPVIAPLVASTCDFAGFEIDGNLTAGDCPPGGMDWNTPGLGVTQTGSTGTYGSSNKDRNDPTGWISGGAGADQATFAKVYAWSNIVAGDFLVYTGFTRTAVTGTFGFTVEITNAPSRTGNGVPQPDRSLGGTVHRVEQHGNGDISFIESCVYTSQATYDSNCSSSGSGFVWQTNNGGPIANPLDGGATIPVRGFLEMGLNITDLTGVAPGCPAPTASTVYLRSWTGNDNNLQKWAGAISVAPPSTCGALEVTKAGAPAGVASDYSFGYTIDRIGDGAVVAPSTSTVTDALKIGETDQYANVPAGTDFTLVEAAIPANIPWTHLSTVCTVPGYDAPFVLTSPTDTFPVVEGGKTSCVITNTTSLLTVTKVAQGQQNQAFGFDLNGQPGADLSLVGTSAPGTTSAPMLYKPGTAVTITELLDATNAGNGAEADWSLRDITGGVVDTANKRTVVTTVAGQTVNAVFTNVQHSSVVVEKRWIVNGVEYADPNQPDGLDAALTVTGPGSAGASAQGWGVQRDGYFFGDSIEIGESTTIDPLLTGCTMTASRVTLADGAVVDLPAPSTFILADGLQSYTVTNTVTCVSRLTLGKIVVGGSATPDQWTLTAYTTPDGAPATGSALFSGTDGVTAEVTPDQVLQLAESNGPAVYVQDDNRATPSIPSTSPLASGSWECVQVDAEQNPIPGSEFTAGDDGLVAVPLGLFVRCDAVNRTAQVTLLKLVQNTHQGTRAAVDFLLSATPTARAGLAGTTVDGGTTVVAANTFDVRPGHSYSITEEARTAGAAYLQLGVQKYTGDVAPDGSVDHDDPSKWVDVDPSALTVAAGEHAIYRFVNGDPPAFILPLTGGLSTDAFVIVGAVLLLVALGTAVWHVRRKAWGRRV